MAAGSTSPYLLALFLIVSMLHNSLGDLNDILTSCCVEGIKWAVDGGRCDSFGSKLNVSREDIGSCMAIIEVCCMKEVHLQKCAEGKQTALDNKICIMRDIEPGREQYMECCHCCKLGLTARSYGLSCESPVYGDPCDTKFVECCTGREISINQSAGALQNVTSHPIEGALQVHTEDDKDECALFPNKLCSQKCVNTPGSFQCECSNGYILDADGRTCRLTQEGYNCMDSNPCEQQCQQDSSGVRCSCYEGYQLNDDQITCSDIDECALGYAKCGALEECVNVLGRYTCKLTSCPPGYVKNPTTGNCEQKIDCPPGYGLNSVSGRCEDIDECTVYSHSCYGEQQLCVNLNGSYKCDCLAGYHYNVTAGQCQDINECAIGTNTCQSGERCENKLGSYTCRRIYSCGTGYTLDTETQRCVDTNECQLNIHNCGNGYECQNTNGSFRCIPKACQNGSRFNPARGACERVTCRRGFRPGPHGNCVDINECQDYQNVCGNFQRCQNTIGSYTCRSTLNCPPGFQPAKNGRCVDIDECETGSHRCGSDQQCVNRQGSYFCQCPRGYRTGPGGRCEDVDECSYGAAICPSSSRCTNTPGSYTCQCKEGLQDDGQGSCSDIDECQTANICHHSCVNVIGSYFCSCNRGYQLADDKRLCEDINECTHFGGRGGRGGIRGGVCGGRCVNLQGSYRCECPEGWRVKADGRSCEDIDECKTGGATCRNRDEFCVNVRGSFKCPLVRCPDGFVKIPSGGRQNSAGRSELIADDGGVVCGRSCAPTDVNCHYNKTKTVSWQFLALPQVEFVREPLTLLNIRTIGYSIYPNLDLRIIDGNRDGLFSTVVEGDQAFLKLLKPLFGPAEHMVTMKLENRDFSRKQVISRHITHAQIYVSDFPQ